MLNILEWSSIRYPLSTPRISRPRPVTGISATGLDLAIRLIVGMRQAQADTVGQYRLQSATLSTTLRPQNQRALALLNAWMAETDELGEEWWSEFEQGLKIRRFSLREWE